MSKGLRRNFSITTNDFSLKYVLITVPVVIMPMNSLIHLLPPGGDCFFSAWVRAGPSYCVTSNGAHRPRGPSDLMHGGATPPLWCSASGSTTPLSHEKASDKPQSGDELQGVWPVFFKWPRSWKTGRNWGCVPDWRRPRRHKVRSQVDPGLDLGVEERMLLTAWWPWNSICDAANGVVPASVSLDQCTLVV